MLIFLQDSACAVCIQVFTRLGTCMGKLAVEPSFEWEGGRPCPPCMINKKVTGGHGGPPSQIEVFVHIFVNVIKTLILLLLLPLYLSAADTTPDALVGKLQNCYRTIDSMKAALHKVIVQNAFRMRSPKKGRSTSKGGLMRWEYEQPEKKVFVSDSEFYWYYVPDDKQVIKAPVSANGQNSPTLFLAGRGDFGRDFRAEWADPRPGSHIVRLTPLAPQPDFKYLIVDVDPVKGLVLRLEVVDEYDNRTEYTFQQIKENPSLPENFFTFQPPPGTDILFQRQDKE